MPHACFQWDCPTVTQQLHVVDRGMSKPTAPVKNVRYTRAFTSTLRPSCTASKSVFSLFLLIKETEKEKIANIIWNAFHNGLFILFSRSLFDDSTSLKMDLPMGHELDKHSNPHPSGMNIVWQSYRQLSSDGKYS
jgi:hypothetical protein